MKAWENLKGYALVLGLCAIAIPIALHYDIPSSTFLLVAMASALFGGRKPGLFAVVVLALSFDFFFLATRFYLLFPPELLVRFVFFIGAMLLATEMIHARRRSDLARFEREREFRILTETCPDCVLIVDENRVIEYANPATTAMFKFSVDELHGNPASFLLPSLAAGQLPAGEFLARRKQHEDLEVEATCGAFNEKTAIFLRDISDRKRAQRELERSEANHRLVLDTIPGMVFSRLPDGTIDYFNRHMVEYFGLSFEETRGGAWVNHVHPDERDSVLDAIERQLAGAEPYVTECRCRRFDGAYRWIHTNIQPLRERDGKVVRWYALLTDVDDRRQMEDSLRQTEARLSQAAQMATAAELSAAIVHEISQPISAMVANGQACLRWLSVDPPSIANGVSAVERIVRDGKDAREIVKSLRTLFKKRPPQKIPLNLREIVDEVVILTRNRMVRDRIALDISLPAQLPAILADRIQVQQVLVNLVSNAIEAMSSIAGRPRTLQIRARPSGESVLTEIVDSGEGIADPEKVFESFFTTKENGMGIGLPVCRSIVEAHGGRLWAAKAEPFGSVFSFTLPFAELAALLA